MSMISQISIVQQGKHLYLRSPQSRSNAAHFRVFGGIWERINRRWRFRFSPEVELMITELFGASSPNVKVRVAYQQIEPCGIELKIGGYMLATWRGPKVWRQHVPAGVIRYKHPAGYMFHAVVRRDFAQRCRLKIVENPVQEIPMTDLAGVTNAPVE